MKEVINGETKTVTRTVYAVAWETDKGDIMESIWCHDPRPGKDTTVLAEIEVTYQCPANLDFVRPDKSERIAMLKAELAKLGVSHEAA